MVTNNGSTVLTLSGAITGPDASAFVLNSTGSVTVSPTGTTTFNITGTPARLGFNSATLTVTDATSGFSNSIPPSIYGYPQAPTVTPGSITFSPAKLGVQSAPRTIAISAPNGDPVSFVYTSGSPYPGTDFAVSFGTCATQTPCQVTVTFTPSQTGPESANYTVRDLVTDEQSSMSLQGTGGVGSVSLSSSSLTFAARDIGTTSIPQTVTLTNSGDAILTISGETFSGANVGDFPIEANSCGSSLAAGANCTLTISFDPTASGARSATLQIMTNAASSPDNIQLMGTGN
ncbi:choice-of-anchor D domain-containing protein [Tunturiibacter empetritectus]|uniref:choice-of-anchor D domain-containing protein n=1 Tax=Tunturiibacter empetritectus TaxID=3069691 RepID=UPI00160C666C